MNDDQLQFDRTCHVIYSRPCKAEIREKIAHHYPESQREAVWERVQMQYVDFLSDWRTDLGGEKNFHNGPGGNCDCIALMAYYVVCRDVISLQEIEEMEGNLFLPSFRKLSKLKFIDINKPLCKKLLHRAFLNAKKQCDKWGDFEMHVAPFDKDQPIYYEFTACPTAEFAKKHDLLEVMPALCNPDFAGMELIHARLIRKTTCSNGCKCDYTICGDKDPYCREHPEYRDEQGYRIRVRLSVYECFSQTFVRMLWIRGGVRNPLIVFSRMATSMGLEMWASMPAAMLFCMSSEKALAVIAMMGMVLPRGFLPPRMAFVAS